MRGCRLWWSAYQLDDGGFAAVSQVIPEVLARGPRREGIDAAVPETLQGNHKSTHKGKRNTDLAIVNDRVKAISTRGNPGNENGREEEHGTLGIGPSSLV